MSVPDNQIEQPQCFCANHADECGCAHCHEHQEHDWREWAVYPMCEGCEAAMLECWADEIKVAA